MRANHGEGSYQSAEGDDLEPSIPETARDTAESVEGSEGNEGNFAIPQENRAEKFSPSEAPSKDNQPENLESGESALTAFSASQLSHSKESVDDNCLESAFQLPSLPQYEEVKVSDQVMDVITGIRGTAIAVLEHHVVFNSKEWGLVQRHRDLVKIIE